MSASGSANVFYSTTRIPAPSQPGYHHHYISYIYIYQYIHWHKYTSTCIKVAHGGAHTGTYQHKYTNIHIRVVLKDISGTAYQSNS